MSVKPSADSDRRRAGDADSVEKDLIERAFGYREGPLFDRRNLPPGLLDEFINSEAVERATRRYALEMMKSWKEAYPGKPALRVAYRPVGQPAAVQPLHEPVPPLVPVPVPVPLTTAPAPAPAPAPPPPPPAAKSAEHKMTFVLPNARLGEPYRARIEIRDAAVAGVEVCDLRLPDHLGLAFDANTGEVHGTPTEAGDHTLTALWKGEAGVSRSASFILIVNANPRDLWKSIEPDPADPYLKPNEASTVLPAGKMRLVAASKRGRSHAHAGTCRDDDYFVLHLADTGWTVLVVTDGAGGAKNSRKGAQLAAQEAGRYISSELAGGESALLLQAFLAHAADSGPAAARAVKDRLYQLFGRAAFAGLRAIDAEAAARSAAVKDYNTTLLCAVCLRSDAHTLIGSFWIGDGAICAYSPPGSSRLLGKPDSGEFAGQTRFLDKATLGDATTMWERIELGVFDASTVLLLMTDGISDPRFETDSGLADPSKWDSLWAELTPLLAQADAGRALVDWMDFFSPGHHDDRTIAVVW